MITRCFLERFLGCEAGLGSWRIVRFVFVLRKPDVELRKRIKSNKAIALTSVMSKWYATCIIQRLEKDKEPEETKQLQVGGIDGISCQHLQVLMTQLLQKPWEWQKAEGRTCGTEVKEGLRCMLPVWISRRHLTWPDRNTSGNSWGDQNVDVWIVAAFLREMAGLEGRATFEHVDGTFPLTRCVRQGSVQTPRLWLKMAMQISWKKTGRRLEEEEGKKRKMELHTETSEGGFHQRMQALCGQTIVGFRLSRKGARS